MNSSGDEAREQAETAERLVVRLRAVELALGEIRSELTVFAAGAIPKPKPAAAPLPAAVTDTPVDSKSKVSAAKLGYTKHDLEQLIAGKGLFIAGLTLVALAAAFFLKIAFDA